jgi:hypothetical protein
MGWPRRFTWNSCNRRNPCMDLVFKLYEITKPNILYKHGLAQAVYLELMQQKKPLELIFKLFEVTKPNMLYKHGLDQTVYLELMQQKKPLELIFKLYEVIKPNML